MLPNCDKGSGFRVRIGQARSKISVAYRFPSLKLSAKKYCIHSILVMYVYTYALFVAIEIFKNRQPMSCTVFVFIFIYI